MSKFKYWSFKLHKKDEFKQEKNGKFFYNFPKKDCMQIIRTDEFPQGFMEWPLYTWQERELEKDSENYKKCLKLFRIYSYMTDKEKRYFLEMVNKWFELNPRNKYLIITYEFKKAKTRKIII